MIPSSNAASAHELTQAGRASYQGSSSSKPQQSTFGPTRGRGVTMILGAAEDMESFGSPSSPSPAAPSSTDISRELALAGSATISASMGAAVNAEVRT